MWQSPLFLAPHGRISKVPVHSQDKSDIFPPIIIHIVKKNTIMLKGFLSSNLLDRLILLGMFARFSILES